MHNKFLDKIELKLLADCKEHITALATLHYNELARHWVPNASIEKAKLWLSKHLNHEELPLTLVALYDNKPIGMASLRINDGLELDYAPWLGSLVVDPAFRSLKVGEYLIDSIKNKTHNFGYSKLYLLAFDKTLPKWYTKLGWVEIGKEPYLGHSVTVMEVLL